ncbi:MAG: helix-turn-helix transcriptional regulator [Hornefia butyriciproducens]|uniref:helix-turn-helix domain-containing protein n=1 Tax=Hornefia butyriciproducens TaxID=2652293 RepID=UPI002A75CD2C|nr:helix-turn-helix transcriptional regulator [Hornefia butyriciproducens]MDY2990636.1 helix-turn-helix transcriptional regulator [Hornefia butyriciproducens]
MDFAEVIKGLRQECYLSQQALADELGVSFSTVNRWENSKAVPNYQTMKRLVEYCKALNIDCTDIESAWKENKNA